MAEEFVLNPGFLAELGSSPEVGALMQALADDAVDESRQRAGGHKRYEDSIGGEAVDTPEGWVAVVGFVGRDAFITRFSEFGTRHQPPRPMIRPGVQAALDKVGGHMVSDGGHGS